MCLRAGGPGRPLSLGVCLHCRRVCGAEVIEDELRGPTRSKPEKDGQTDGNRTRTCGINTSDEAERERDGRKRPTQKAETYAECPDSSDGGHIAFGVVQRGRGERPETYMPMRVTTPPHGPRVVNPWGTQQGVRIGASWHGPDSGSSSSPSLPPRIRTCVRHQDRLGSIRSWGGVSPRHRCERC